MGEEIYSTSKSNSLKSLSIRVDYYATTRWIVNFFIVVICCLITVFVVWNLKPLLLPLSNSDLQKPASETESKADKAGTMTLEDICKVLIHAYPGMKEPMLPEDEARERAKLLFNDMRGVNFPLYFEWWPVAYPGYEDVGIPTYKLIGSKYDVDSDEVEDVYKACGPGLSCGDLVKLSYACYIGHQLIPNMWPNQFARRLRNSDDHLAVIEEIIWLNCWYTPEYVRQNYNQNPDRNKDVDWRFSCRGQVVNLEVKYHRRDWIGVVDGPYFSREFVSYFDDVEGKFGPQQDGEINIIGISTLAPPDEGFRKCIKGYLDVHPEIDAIIILSYHDPQDETPEIFSDKHDIINDLFCGIDTQNRPLISPIRHVWRKSEERRALRSGEFPPDLLN